MNHWTSPSEVFRLSYTENKKIKYPKNSGSLFSVELNNNDAFEMDIL